MDIKGDIAGAIRTATNKVFSMMLSAEISAEEIPVAGVAAGSQSRVVARLGLAGDWAGCGSVSCEPEFASRIASLLQMTP